MKWRSDYHLHIHAFSAVLWHPYFGNRRLVISLHGDVRDVRDVHAISLPLFILHFLDSLISHLYLAMSPSPR